MEKLTLEQALAIFVEVIVKDMVHADYHHVCNKAILYKQLITGEDIEDLLIRFNPREDDVLFEQRKRITQVITPAIASSLMKPFYKVPRTDRVIKKVMSKDGDNADAVEEVLDKMKNFYGSEDNVNGLDYYLQNRFVELTFADPNSFIVTDFDPFDPTSEKASPYPWEVSCEMARYFEYVNNELLLLVSRTDITYDQPWTQEEIKAFKKQRPIPNFGTHYPVDGFKWIMFTDNNSIVFEEIATDYTVAGEEDEDYDPSVSITTLDNGKRYKIEIHEHKADKVNAKRVGYKRDLVTDGRTFVNPFDDALCYFIDSIKTVSEFSLTKSQHVFPQKIQYVPPCPGESELNSCFNGKAAGGGICKVCKGTGNMPIHTSAQDVITMRLPDDTSKMVDLNKVMAYFSPPIELIKFQNELVKQVKVDCHQTVFNSTVLLKDTTGQAATTETATSKNFDMDSINDTLAPFGEVFSSTWLFFADMIARFTDNAELVEFIHRLPADYKMKSISDLYSEMQIANDSNAPIFLIELLNDDIASTKFQDDPDQLQMYDVKKRLNPFRGMTDSQIAMTMTLEYTPLWKKVLSTNFEDILLTALEEKDDFYMLDYKEQIDMVKAITFKLIEEINETKVTPTLKPISTPVVE